MRWLLWPYQPRPLCLGIGHQSPDGTRTEQCGFIQKQGANNIAELTAAIESLRKVPEGAQVILYSDSQYVMKGLNEWMPGWIKKGWKTAAGKPVLNLALWQQLYALYSARKVQVEWVRGHNGHPENEKADQLANRGLSMG